MTAIVREGRRRALRRPSIAVTALLGAVALVVLAAIDLSIGSPTLSPGELLTTLAHPDDSQTAIIVHTIRLPRVVLAVAAGAALAVAGVVMQALTRNPLADPGILGVNAGASFAVAFAFVVLNLHGFGVSLGFAFLGAAATSIVVALIGTAGRSASTARLILAGVAVGAVLAGLTQALSLLDPADYADIRVWEAGSLAARDLPTAVSALAVVIVGVTIALVLGPSLNILSLGEDAAHSLGARIPRIRAASLVAVVLLCGTATAAVGPIAFVGLLVPHAVRAVTGADLNRTLRLSLLFGPLLMLASDIIARLVIAPRELPLGVVTAILGAPLLIALVQRRRSVA